MKWSKVKEQKNDRKPVVIKKEPQKAGRSAGLKGPSNFKDYKEPGNQQNNKGPANNRNNKGPANSKNKGHFENKNESEEEGDCWVDNDEPTNEENDKSNEDSDEKQKPKNHNRNRNNNNQQPPSQPQPPAHPHRRNKIPDEFVKKQDLSDPGIKGKSVYQMTPEEREKKEKLKKGRAIHNRKKGGDHNQRKMADKKYGI